MGLFDPVPLTEPILDSSTAVDINLVLSDGHPSASGLGPRFAAREPGSALPRITPLGASGLGPRAGLADREARRRREPPSSGPPDTDRERASRIGGLGGPRATSSY